jgi:ketosteroid isomerase-like protein
MNYPIRYTLRCLTRVLSIIGISIEASAQAATGTASFDSVKAVKEIAHENKTYTDALSRSDSVAISNLYTADARILNDGSPSTIGRVAIMHFYGGMISNGVTGFSYATTGVWGSDNNLIVEDGILTFALSSGKVVAKGRYLLVWKREGGKLKIFRDTFFSDSK